MDISKKEMRLGRDSWSIHFREKPDFETAKLYQESGSYFWNAGMFIAPIKSLLEEFKKHGNQYFHLKDEVLENLDHPEKLIQTYQKLPKDSIDYAIMEKSSEVAVVEANLIGMISGHGMRLAMFWKKKMVIISFHRKVLDRLNHLAILSLHREKMCQ